MLFLQTENLFTMNKIGIIFWILVTFFAWPTFAWHCPQAPAMPADALTLQSPDHQLELKFAVVGGVPQYSLDRNGKPVVLPSRMGFTLEWRDDLAHAFVLKDKTYSTFDETWEPVWGEERSEEHTSELQSR